MQTPTPEAQPWWRHGHVWLVVSGPAAVVVAGFVTMWIAMRAPDPVIGEDLARRGPQLTGQLRSERALAPAMQVRNHAATPARER